MRTTFGTPHTPLAIDAMRPWQAFATPAAPWTADPRRWLDVVLVVLTALARAGARVRRPGAAARSPAEGMAS